MHRALPSIELDSSKSLYAYIVMVTVVTNHMNGKDTHVRGLRVLGPLEYVSLIHQFVARHPLIAYGVESRLRETTPSRF
jgi:hypothetical protein